MMDAKKYLSRDKLAAKIIVALAGNDMKASAAAREIYVHKNTLLYHTKKMAANTGLDPLKFYDLCELLPVARQILKKG